MQVEFSTAIGNVELMHDRVLSQRTAHENSKNQIRLRHTEEEGKKKNEYTERGTGAKNEVPRWPNCSSVLYRSLEVAVDELPTNLHL